MLWHNLRLRTRMLIGYGLMFLLVAVLAIFLILRTAELNEHIVSLSTQVTTEAAAGARLTSQVANAQQTIDRYLQQPITDNLRVAGFALQSLTSEISSAYLLITNTQQLDRLRTLDQRLQVYKQGFQELSSLMEEQQAMHAELNDHLNDATSTMNDVLSLYLATPHPDSTVMTTFVRAQRHLELTILWSSRPVDEQSDATAQVALADLDRVDFSLTLNSSLLDTNTKNTIARVKSSVDLTRKTISRYMENVVHVRQQRDKLLNEQGGLLKLESDAIANAALAQLTEDTQDLEEQGQQTQQISGAALILTLVVAAIFGGVIPGTIVRPILDLVAATKRLNQGDYTVFVATRDKSEIGLLATVFNQTTAALDSGRREVARQQEALAQQNQELEQALQDLRATVAERNQMAITIRALSVPVVPILNQVILVPLVGEIDAERGRVLLERVLERVTAERVRFAILDVTGVPMVDESLVDWLLKVTISARLMGARCILVGISPEVAQALVASGADLNELATRADLRSAVEYAGRKVGAALLRR